MLEHPDPGQALHVESVAYLAGIRHFLAELAGRAGVQTPTSFAREWHILMKGSIVAAGEGDRDAARRAQRMAALVLRDAPTIRAPCP